MELSNNRPFSTLHIVKSDLQALFTEEFVRWKDFGKQWLNCLISMGSSSWQCYRWTAEWSCIYALVKLQIELKLLKKRWEPVYEHIVLWNHVLNYKFHATLQLLNTLRTAWFRRFSQKKTAVFGCLTNVLAPPPIALESCSTAQPDQPV